jgi:hypothetical protein
MSCDDCKGCISTHIEVPLLLLARADEMTE